MRSRLRRLCVNNRNERFVREGRLAGMKRFWSRGMEILLNLEFSMCGGCVYYKKV
ncbi:hypothetical protein ANAPC1_00117 [Anaplasma phagocytophilum]|uniref:Uncharacterized protein n=1 Tax=Anaplasma phagocytophilum TaxID=948 RepID=A0AA45US09_ANAPH|nr:hypothetical protein [Anaplasma phagocytophilum]SBO13779.1 hypothetical protein ANAPC1_00117 [Anaplasma phagocytophilum]